MSAQTTSGTPKSLEGRTAIVTGGALATLLAGLIFALRPLAARPARVLRARGDHRSPRCKGCRARIDWLSAWGRRSGHANARRAIIRGGLRPRSIHESVICRPNVTIAHIAD